MDQYGKGTLHFPLELEHGKPTTQPMLTESAALPLTAHHIAISHVFSDRIQHRCALVFDHGPDTATSCVPRRETYRVQPESHSS